MKKILNMVLVLSIVLVCFSGCGEKTEAPNELVVWTDIPLDASHWDPIIAKWNSAYPDTPMKFEKFPGAERTKKLSLAKEANELPHVYFGATFSFLDEAFLGNIQPITEIVNSVIDDISPSTLDLTYVNDEHYALPMYSSTFGLLYNADIFKAAGLEDYIADGIANWNLDEFETVILPALKAYMEGTEKYPLIMFAGNEQADTYHHNIMKSYGGEIIKDGKVVAADDSNTIKGLEKVLEWYNLGFTNSNAITKQGQECGADFQAQVSAICFGQYSNYTANNAAMASGKIEEFDMRIATQPTADGSGVVASYVYSGFVMDTKNEAENEIGRKFMEFLANDKEGLEILNNGGIPAFKSINIETAKTNKLMEHYASVDHLIYSFSGQAPGYAATRALLFPSLQAALAGDMTAGEALRKYQDGANEIIEEYASKSSIMK